MNQYTCRSCGEKFDANSLHECNNIQWYPPTMPPPQIGLATTGLSYSPPQYQPTRRDYFAAAALTGLLAYGTIYDHSYTVNQIVEVVDKLIEKLDGKND